MRLYSCEHVGHQTGLSREPGEIVADRRRRNRRSAGGSTTTWESPRPLSGMSGQDSTVRTSNRRRCCSHVSISARGLPCVRPGAIVDVLIAESARRTGGRDRGKSLARVAGKLEGATFSRVGSSGSACRSLCRSCRPRQHRRASHRRPAEAGRPDSCVRDTTGRSNHRRPGQALKGGVRPMFRVSRS